MAYNVNMVQDSGSEQTSTLQRYFLPFYPLVGVCRAHTLDAMQQEGRRFISHTQ